MVAGIFGKRLGIVGGLGPETSCSFCLELNNRIRQISECQPDIVMENVAVPLRLEKRMIKGAVLRDMFDLLAKAVVRLNRAEADFIVIPCNTVHVFIEDLRKISKKPIISIIEVCAEECCRRGFSKVGILGSSTTIKQKLHENELIKKGIRVCLPKNQSVISRVILRILNNAENSDDKRILLESISELKADNAEAVILGCTDLDILISEKDSALPLIDTTKVLLDAVVKLIA